MLFIIFGFFNFMQMFQHINGRLPLWLQKQQSSLHAPWAQVCNENRSAAITQNLSARREPCMEAFSGIFYCVCIQLPFLSSPNEAMKCVWGWGREVRRMWFFKNIIYRQRLWQDKFQIDCKKKANIYVLPSSLVTFRQPWCHLRSNKLESQSHRWKVSEKSKHCCIKGPRVFRFLCLFLPQSCRWTKLQGTEIKEE